jgi:hypothetical protein
LFQAVTSITLTMRNHGGGFFQASRKAGGVLVLGNTDIRVSFTHADCMFKAPSKRKQFVVTCKLCRRDVPSGAKEFPFRPIVVTCSLCGEKRQYLSSEVFLGRPHHVEEKRT